MFQGHVEVDFENAKLWLRFMDYIEIIKDFICCEIFGMLDGQLNAVTALLNFFAATGHNMPSLLASMSRKCASFRQLIPGFTRSLSKDITLCEGVRYYGRDSGQTL